MKILMAGAGSIGKRHLRNLLDNQHKNITVVEVSDEQIAEVKNLHPNVECVKYDKEFSIDEYDVVFICTPPQLHLEYLEKAIKGSCHCFVEKPFALTSENIESLLLEADRKDLKIMTGFNMRYLKLIMEMKNKLSEGVIGDVLSCRINLSSYMPAWHPLEDYREGFMAYYNSGGGALFDYVHGLDLAQWLVAPIKSIYCAKETALLDMETDDMAALIGMTEKKVCICFYFDFLDRVPRKSIDIIGTEGTMIWEFSTQESLRYFTEKNNEWKTVYLKNEYETCYVRLIRHFFDAIENNTSFQTDGYNGLSTMRVLDAAQESAISGKVVNIF